MFKSNITSLLLVVGIQAASLNSQFNIAQEELDYMPPSQDGNSQGYESWLDRFVETSEREQQGTRVPVTRPKPKADQMILMPKKPAGDKMQKYLLAKQLLSELAADAELERQNRLEYENENEARLAYENEARLAYENKARLAYENKRYIQQQAEESDYEEEMVLDLDDPTLTLADKLDWLELQK